MSGNLLDELGYFEGVSMEEALSHALPLEAPVNVPGTPVGISADSAKSPVGADLTLKRKLDGRLNNKSVGIIGEQDIGKTFLLYVLLYIWSAEARGANARGIQVDSLKHNDNKRPETATLIEDLLKCTVIQVATAHLNPLNRLWDFTFEQQYRMVKTMLEVWWEKALTAHQETLLDFYLSISYYEVDHPTFDALAEDILSYRAGDKITPNQGSTMEAAALELSNMVRALTRGDLGTIFSDDGQDETLLKLIEQFAKSWDFHAVGSKERSIIEVFRGTIELSALSLKDPSNPESGARHPERVAQYIGRDEAYDAWKNRVFAQSEFRRMKTLRELDITLAMCFHRLVDFLSSVGSEEARNVIREIPTWFIGRQSEADIPDLRRALNLPEYVLLTLPTLTKGHFWLIMPGHEPRLIAVLGTELEIKTFVTNQANEALLQQYLETGDIWFFFQWLEETTPPPKEDSAAQRASNSTPQGDFEVYNSDLDQPNLDKVPSAPVSE